MRLLASTFRSTTALVAMASTMTFGLGGCSFLLAKAPPPNHQQLMAFDCSPELTYPLIDMGLGVLALGEAASPELDKGGKAVAVGAAVLAAGSAVYGVTQTSKCKEAKLELYARLPTNPIVPMAPPPDPWLSPPPGIRPPAPNPYTYAPPAAPPADPWLNAPRAPAPQPSEPGIPPRDSDAANPAGAPAAAPSATPGLGK